MKIEDWDKLEELGFIYINDAWMKGKNKYVRKICESCRKPFLSQNGLGRYCDRKCSNIKRKSISIDVLKTFFQKEGYKLLTKEYVNNRQKLWYICPNNHKHYTYLNNWIKGCRCGYCTGKYKLYLPDVIGGFEKEGYKVITNEIKNSKQKIHLKCPNGHNFYVSWDNWKRHYIRCTCNINSSPYEIYLYNFLKEYKPEIGNRSILKNDTDRYLELDIYIPLLNKAIEFNGDYWHCNPSKYDKDYYHKQLKLFAYQIWERDKKKKLLCDKNGIQLLIIWEYDWINNHKHMKNIIKEFLR